VLIPIDPLYAFVFAGLFSPGPNVILLTASGARFGFRATLPHVLGVAAGVGMISGLTGLGIGSLLLAAPAVALMLKLAASGWILFMAYKLLTSARAGSATAGDAPWSFGKAAAFQWVNPKVWAFSLAAAAGYPAGLTVWAEALRLATAFSGINLFVCLFWSFAGSLLIGLLRPPRLWVIFNSVMAALLGLSAVLVFF
jgi:threonine/homoserine/homoserine lactone efflux protein